MGAPEVNSTTNLNVNGVEWEAVPSYFTVVQDMYTFLNMAWARHKQHGNYSFPRDILLDFELFTRFTSFDILLLTTLAVGFTLLRHVLTKHVFLPWGSYLKLTPESASKLPESCWKLLYYFSIWSYCFYVVVYSGKYHFFQRPSTCFENYDVHEVVNTDIYILYMVTLAFYLHSMYAVFYQDVWRTDSNIMLIHHIVTLLLVSVSYVVRCHNVGCLTLLFHDCCDIELEFSKINVYLKVRNGKIHRFNDLLAAVSFLSMTVTWFIARLYYFPLKALYATSSVFIQKNLVFDYAFFLDVMLIVLLAMNVLWFTQIVALLYKILSGELKELDDIREFDVVEKIEKTASKKKAH